MEKVWDKIFDYGLDAVGRVVGSKITLEDLERSSRSLSEKAYDVEEEIENAERSGRKKRKRAVEHWLEEVKTIEWELPEVAEELQTQGFFERLRGKDPAGELNDRVQNLVEKSRHFGELVVDDFKPTQVKFLTYNLVGQAFQQNLEKMMKTVGEFEGIYNQSASHWPSGASDEQITAEAREAFKRQNENKPFKFEHVWKLVREEPKWKTQSGFSSSYQSSKKTRINEAGEYTSSGPPETPASQAESNYDYPDFEPPSTEEPPSVERRPMGQKAAKRKGKGKVGEPSREEPDEEDRYVEVTQMMAEKVENLMAAVNNHNQLKEKIARAEWQQKLWELEDRDTSNMTPAAIAKLTVRIATIKETWGLD